MVPHSLYGAVTVFICSETPAQSPNGPSQVCRAPSEFFQKYRNIGHQIASHIHRLRMVRHRQVLAGLIFFFLKISSHQLSHVHFPFQSNSADVTFSEPRQKKHFWYLPGTRYDLPSDGKAVEVSRAEWRCWWKSPMSPGHSLCIRIAMVRGKGGRGGRGQPNQLWLKAREHTREPSEGG